jgi:hypothetical protein
MVGTSMSCRRQSFRKQATGEEEHVYATQTCTPGLTATSRIDYCMVHSYLHSYMHDFVQLLSPGWIRHTGAGTRIFTMYCTSIAFQLPMRAPWRNCLGATVKAHRNQNNGQKNNENSNGRGDKDGDGDGDRTGRAKCTVSMRIGRLVIII